LGDKPLSGVPSFWGAIMAVTWRLRSYTRATASDQRREVTQHRPKVATAPRHDAEVPHLVEPEDPR
jgi:hypothetical protein